MCRYQLFELDIVDGKTVKMRQVTWKMRYFVENTRQYVVQLLMDNTDHTVVY